MTKSLPTTNKLFVTNQEQIHGVAFLTIHILVIKYSILTYPIFLLLLCIEKHKRTHSFKLQIETYPSPSYHRKLFFLSSSFKAFFILVVPTSFTTLVGTNEPFSTTSKCHHLFPQGILACRSSKNYNIHHKTMEAYCYYNHPLKPDLHKPSSRSKEKVTYNML